MSKLVTVIGATGIQGGSVINALLNNASYSVRGVTRNIQSDASQALALRGVDMVEADVNDLESLRVAFKGSYAIFAMTNFFDSLPTLGVDRCIEIESRLGINLANAAAATVSLRHYIWSTLPDARKISEGKMPIPYWQSKTCVDEHIKAVPELFQKTTFVWFGWYAGNMNYPWYQPSPIYTNGPPKYVQLLASPPSVRLSLIGDERTNVGLFVESILEQPYKTLPSKYVLGVVEQMSMMEIVSTFASAQGIQAQCVEISSDDYISLWPLWAEQMHVTHSYLLAMNDKAFSREEGLLTKDDLHIRGLIGSMERFKTIKQWT